MVPVDKRTERCALREVAEPINLSRARERLRQAKNCQQESEDYYRPHEKPETSRRIREDQGCREVNQQGG